MKNKQTNRRLLSLLLSLCLMLSLVTPAMAAGEETAGQETGQTTACPTEIKAVTVTLEATRWPEGEEKPAPITLTTANVFRYENSDAIIYVELSGRSDWSDMYFVHSGMGDHSGHRVSSFESCGRVHWTEEQTGSLNYCVSVRNSDRLENATVVYGVESPAGETAPEGVTILTTYAATEEEFPALTADQFQQEVEWWSTADFNGNATVMLPQGMLDDYDSSELSMKLYDKAGGLCGSTVPGNGVYFYEDSISDSRYEEIFQTNPSIRTRCTRAYENIYLGHALTAGSYDVRLYSGDTLIREFPDSISVTALPVVSARGYSSIGANVAGGTTAYATLTVSNGVPEDFSVAVYDGDECISSGVQTRLSNAYNGRIQLECIIGLTKPMKRYGSYQLRVVSEQAFQLASGAPRLYVQEEELISVELVNGVYANAVLFSAGYDPQQSYRVSLKKDDRTLATTYASPDENGVWDIEFTDDSGKLLELEEGFYNIYVETKYGGSGVGAYHQMYERSDSSGGSSGGSGGSGTVPEVSAPTADELPLTVSYSYAGPTNDRQFYAVLDVNKNCPNLSYITDKNSFVLVAHAMDGKTYQLPLSSMDQYEWDNVRRYRLNFAPGQATDGYYLFELYYGGRSVTNQTDHKNVAARDYAGLLSSRVEGNFSYNTPDTGVRITNWINVDNVSDGMATVSLYAFGNRTAVPDHTITVPLSEDGGARITAEHLAGLPLFRRYAGEISRGGSLVGGNSAEYGYFASEELTEGNQSFTAAVGSSDPNGKLQLLDYGGNDVNGTALRALEELYVAASPADGYRLKPNSIKVNGQSILGRSFLLTEDCTVTAEFEEIPEVTYAITTASHVRNGTISANVSRAVAGQTVTVTPQPNEGYVFSLGSSHATYWVKNEDGSSHSENVAFTRSSDGTITFEMPAADVELYAYFREPWDVSVSLNVREGGSDNDELKNAVRITDANGNSVVDGTAVEGSTINYLLPQEYTSADGTIYRLSDAYYRYYDQDIGKHVETAVTDAPQGSLTLSYTSSISFNAEYVRYAKYNVTTGSANGGTITVSPASAYPGETITVTATPEEGYILKTGDLRLSGSGSTEIKRVSEDTFTFVMPGADVTVSVSFQNKAYISVNVDSNVSGNGSLRFETSQYANSGTIAKVRTVAAEGSHLADIYAMTTDSLGNPCRIELTLDDSGCYTFTVPCYDVTVYAIFALDRFGGDAKDADTLIDALGGMAVCVNDTTVRLTADVTLTEPLRITGGTLKLLLDGHNIYYYDGTEAAIVVDGTSADFIIDGVSRSSQDTVEGTDGIRGESGGALDVRSGKLTVLGGGYYGGVHIRAGASAVIQSGTPASGMMAAYEAEPTIVSGFTTPALHIEEGSTADIRNAYFFFDGNNCIMTLPDGKTLTDYTAGANILAYIREEDETLTQIKTDYANADIITVGVEGYSVTAAPAEGAVWNLKAEALPANVTAAIPITAKFGYTIKNVWYTTAASGGSMGSGTVVNSTAGGTTESSTSGGSSSSGSAAGGIWYVANSGRWYLNMPAVPITLHTEVEELPERRFLDRTIFSTRETDWYINLWSSINGYSLDYNTGYVVATLMDEEGNTVLSRQENQESYGYINFVSKGIAEGRYRLYVAVGDANQKIELGYQLITAADSIGYNVGIKRGSLTTETRSFEADAYIHETLTLLPSDLTMQLVRFDTATSGTTDTTASGTTTETVVAESRDYTARYYGGNSTTGSSADKQNGSGYSNLLFTFNLGEARLTAGNYALRLVSETTIFTANGENNFSVTEEPWIDSGSFDVNTLTWTAATENIAAGSYTAHYDDQNGQRVNLSMTVAEDGTAKIVFPAWPFQDQVEQLSYTIWINANLGSVEKGFHVEYMVPNAGGGEDNSEWYPMTVDGMWTVNYTEAGAQIWNAIAYSGSSPVLKVTIPGASGSGWYRLNGGSAGEQWGEISDLSAFTVPMSDVQANYRYDLNVFRERNDSWSIASCSGLGFISIPMLGVDPNNGGWFKGDTLTVYPMNLTDAERSTLKFGYKTADKGYVELSYTLNSDGTVTLNVKDVPYGSYRLLAEYRPDGSAKMETLYVGGWMLRNSTYAVETKGGISVAAFEPKTVNGVTMMEVRYENGTPSADVLMRIYKAESVDGSKEMSLSLVKEINIGKNSYTINSSALSLGSGDYVFYFTTTDGTFLGSQFARFGAAEYTVKFLGLYGKLLSSRTVAAGGSVEMPAAPEKEGYTFKGWRDLATGRMVTEVANVTADTTIQAVYEAKLATVTLFFDGGSFKDGNQTEYSVRLGASFNPNDKGNPVRGTDQFLGWYRDIACTDANKVESAFTVTGNVVLYAKWEQRYEIDSSSLTAMQGDSIVSSFSIMSVTRGDGDPVYDGSAQWYGAAQGQEISVDFRMTSGMRCTGVTCIGQTSGVSYPVTLTESSGNYQATFFMPGEAVTLALTYQSANGSITVRLNSSGYYIQHLTVSGGTPWQSREMYVYGSEATIDDLPDGTYYISGTTSSGSFSAQTEITNGGNTVVAIELDGAYSVYGTLTSDTGTLPSGLTAYLIGDSWRNSFSSPVYENGDISFSNVPNGTYTLSVSGRRDYPLSVTEIVVNGEAVDLNYVNSGFYQSVMLTRGQSVTATITGAAALGAKYAYIRLEKATDYRYDYLWSDIYPCEESGTVMIEDIITEPGNYRLTVTDLRRTYYGGDIRFTSEPVKFTVSTDSDGRLSEISKQTLVCSRPAAQIGDLSGNVTIDRTEAYAGELVDLAIRWTSESEAAPQFTITLPSGVEFAESSDYKTERTLTAETGTSGTLHATLRVTGNVSGMLSIPVTAAVNESTGEFGKAVVSVEKIKLTAPVQVKSSEPFTVYGEAAENSLIVLHNGNGETLAVAKTVGRRFSAELKVTADTVLYAETVLENGTVVFRSESVSVAVLNNGEPIAVREVLYSGIAATYNKKLNIYSFWQWVNTQMMGFALPICVSFSGSETIDAVKFLFCGAEVDAAQEGSGVWTATFEYGKWGGAGVKQLTALVTVGEKTLEIPVAEVNLLIDPSGIVTDTNGNPLEGVTVYCQVLRDGQWVNFDAENYGQVNPQVTDKDGRYGWMVPEGEYRILAIKEGYQTYDSLNDDMFSSGGGSTIVIPPVRTDINFSMTPDTSKAYTIFPTAVENATIYCDQSNAVAGQTVTLRASAASGYMLEAIHVTGVDSGKSCPASRNNDGSYSFTMPAERVSYSATLAEAPTEVSVTANGDIKVTGLKTMNVKLIAAFYAANGRMIAITMPTLTMNGTEATATVEMQGNAALRVFLLNSTTNAPLAQCAALALTRT